MTIIHIILGAFLNRVRGGLFNHIPWVDKIDKLVQPIVFGIVTLNPFAAAAMWVGQSPGWGQYIGALSGLDKVGEEQSWIDCLIERLESHPRWWGFAGLSIRGAFWGSCLGLALLDWTLPLYGALMPLFYWPCMELSKYLQSKLGRDKVQAEAGWPWAEWVWGAFIWGVSI